jgi:hypothetical protein
MPSTTAAIALWLFVVNLGIAFGAGVFEHRIVLPRWITFSDGARASWHSEAAREDDTGRRFWVFVTTVPLTLLTIANLAFAWRADPSIRMWWLAAALATLIDRALTFSYFIPTMLRLLNEPDSPQSAAAAARWLELNYVRHAATLAAWLAALKALTLLYQQRIT